jgi:hypothetical protein
MSAQDDRTEDEQKREEGRRLTDVSLEFGRDFLKALAGIIATWVR